jgi:hypothetical protein
MSGIAGLVPYLLLVVGVVAVYVAGFTLWTRSSATPGPTWQSWLLLTAGGTALCVAVAIL